VKFGLATGLRTNRLAIFLLGVLTAISVGLISCQRHSTDAEPRLTEAYSPADGAVGLDILPVSGTKGSRAWLATYTDENGTTKFRIELDALVKASDEGFAMSSGKGRFLAEAGSSPIPLLEGLKKALQAKHMPTKVRKADVLPFDYVSLGENQTRFTDGGFAAKPKGNWTAMKIFLPQGKDEGEVFLNIDAVDHRAEFSIKDPDYGDAVVRELAKVL
jgi:hypothetical protein